MFIPFYVEYQTKEWLVMAIQQSPLPTHVTLERDEQNLKQTKVSLSSSYYPSALLLARKLEAGEYGNTLLWANLQDCRFLRMFENCVMCGAPR